MNRADCMNILNEICDADSNGDDMAIVRKLLCMQLKLMVILLHKPDKVEFTAEMHDIFLQHGNGEE